MRVDLFGRHFQTVLYVFFFANMDLSFINSMKFLAGSLIAPARYAVYLSRHAYLKKIPRFPQHLSDFAKASWNDFALQNLEISSTNLPVLLRYEDKNSMAHSIETRLPFLDYRVLETALSLPNHFKIKEGWSKWILRKAMQGMMPDTIVWRKNKFGFEAPENLWLSQHISEMQDTVLQSALLENVVRKKTLSYLYPHLNLRTQWRLYSIALWEKTFGVSA